MNSSLQPIPSPNNKKKRRKRRTKKVGNINNKEDTKKPRLICSGDEAEATLATTVSCSDEIIKKANISLDNHHSKSSNDHTSSFSLSSNRQHSPPNQTNNNSQHSPSRYPFPVDDADHCETPFNAYKDLRDVLDRLAKSLGKTRSNLVIYDPYYCDGGIKQKLLSLGFSNVINRNRDFYQDIANHTTPKQYDILITNPPYSGVHMEKLLAFANDSSKNNKPWFFLLPHFVYTKDYYRRELSDSLQDKIYFLVPETRYAYVPPSWVDENAGSKVISKGKTKTAPFPSLWYCHVTPDLIPQSWFTNTFGQSGSVLSKHNHHASQLRFANCTKDIPRDFKGEFDITKKRPNPKARKRAAKKRRDEAAMKQAAR